MPDRPHVAEGELDSALVASRPQALVRVDARERAIQQRPRPVDADDLPRAAPQQLSEEPA
jgi:hypothetical protein